MGKWKLASKVARKTGAKVAGSPFGVGEMMMFAEAAPVAIGGVHETGKRVASGLREARGEWRQGRRRKALRQAVRTGLRAPIDMARGSARTAVAAFTVKELAEAALPVRRNGKRKTSDFDCLLSCMIQLRTAYLYLHWNARGYADHLLYERLYQSLDEDTDTLAELTAEQAGMVHPSKPKPYKSVAEAEHGIIAQATALIKSGSLSPAMENYLLNLVEHRRRALYLLRQAQG